MQSISRVIIIPRYIRQIKHTDRKYFQAIEINSASGERIPEVERARTTSISALGRIAIFFLLISASPNVTAIFSHRNATLYELCARHVRPSIRSSVRSSIQQEHAFFAATKLNVRGLWLTELRIVNYRREKWAYVHGHIASFLRSHANAPCRTSTRAWMSFENNAENAEQLCVRREKKLYVGFIRQM